MATYLIDYENVNKDGLNGVSKLTENDRVIIFYSSKADRMTFGLHRRLNETKAAIEYKKVDVGGHNALDFQLATFLGYLISQDSSEEYCVVSNDRGFEYLVGFWRKPLYSVSLTREIATSPQAEERRQHRKQMEKEAAEHSAPEAAAEDHAAEPEPLADKQENKYPVDHSTPRVHESEENTQVMVIDQQKETLPAAAPEQKTEIVEHRPDNQNGRPFRMSSNRKYSSYGHNRGNSQHGRNPEPAAETKDAPAAESQHSGRGDGRKTSPEKRAAENHSGRSAAGSKNTAAGSEKSDEVRKCLAELNLSDSDCDAIASFIGRYKTKLGINNALVRKFGTQKAGDIYRLIKPLIKDKKGSDGKKVVSAEEEQMTRSVTEYVKDLNLSSSDREEIASYVLKYKTKQGINNALVRKFGTQKAGSVYKLIKPLISDKKGPAQKKKPAAEKKADKRTGEVKNLVSGLGLKDEDYSEIASFIQRYKTKQGVNNALVRRFRSQRAGEIYKLIKPLLNDKKGGEN